MDTMKELYEKVAGDSALQNKFAVIMKEAEKAGEEETKEKLIVFAKKAGFTVSVEEMLTFFRKLSEENKGELSEGELDMVAGGKGGNTLVNSALGMGVGCAVASAGAFMSDVNCGNVLDTNPFQPPF